MSFPLAIAIALVLDAMIGWPDGLYRKIGHPVTWMGTIIQVFEKWFNRKPRHAFYGRFAGLVTALSTIFITVLIAYVVTLLLPHNFLGTVITGILAWPFLAVKSMYTHVQAVAKPLQVDNLKQARAEVAMIVGRDPSQLDEPAVVRATLESLAENTSDGIIAPVFWGAVLGLPGIAAYKAINTMDSMIGYRSPRYNFYGWAAARIDDVVNLIPSRLTGLLFSMTSGNAKKAFICILKDARKHRSPNAGWPESALAGALGVRLSGPRQYEDKVAEEPWVNGAEPDPGVSDIYLGLKIYKRTIAALILVLGVIGFIL